MSLTINITKDQVTADTKASMEALFGSITQQRELNESIEKMHSELNALITQRDELSAAITANAVEIPNLIAQRDALNASIANHHHHHNYLNIRLAQLDPTIKGVRLSLFNATEQRNAMKASLSDLQTKLSSSGVNITFPKDESVPQPEITPEQVDDPSLIGLNDVSAIIDPTALESVPKIDDSLSESMPPLEPVDSEPIAQDNSISIDFADGMCMKVLADGTVEYYLGEFLHRDNNLPAIIRPDNSCEWYIQGLLIARGVVKFHQTSEV